MTVAIDLIARNSGVSKSTVSRVLNGRPHVKPELRDKVLAAIEELNYVPRQLAVKKVVAIAVTSIDSGVSVYETALLSGLTASLMKHDLNVRIYPAKSFDLSGSFDVRCVITTCQFNGVEKLIKPNCNLQGIVINGHVPGFHSVRSDHAQGVSLAVERLAAMGHRRIALVADLYESWGNRERIRGYRETVAILKLDNDLPLLQRNSGNLTESIAKAMIARPSAIIVSGEDCAIEANYVLRLLGRRIPEDISLVTFESAAISRHMWPPNSTIDQDIFGLADAAAGLAAKIASGELPEHMVELQYENKFIERDSTLHLNGQC